MNETIEDIRTATPPEAIDFKQDAADLLAMTRKTLGPAGEAICSYTKRQPAMALGVALGLGILLGWTIKRR